MNDRHTINHIPVPMQGDDEPIPPLEFAYQQAVIGPDGIIPYRPNVTMVHDVSEIGRGWIDVTDILRGSDEDHMRVLADIHKSQTKK